ncbi:MAG: hypothetical protein HYY37_01135 [Candidatus Aenigmarchaeota archaeon]|nr:hypothetical protein [Candidatus Aenigmarchaeota archaeon]
MTYVGSRESGRWISLAARNAASIQALLREQVVLGIYIDALRRGDAARVAQASARLPYPVSGVDDAEVRLAYARDISDYTFLAMQHELGSG